jgi:hypothetical protein
VSPFFTCDIAPLLFKVEKHHSIVTCCWSSAGGFPPGTIHCLEKEAFLYRIAVVRPKF